MLLEMSVVIVRVPDKCQGLRLTGFSVDLLHALMSDTTPLYAAEVGLTKDIKREAPSQNEVHALSRKTV